jgi:ferredoxin
MRRKRLESKAERKPVTLREELPLLKARAQAMEARLDRINRRIREMKQGTGIPSSIAVIDSGKCLGCGRCETACPVRAISLEKTAFVNPARCIGCGRCVAECRQGAIRLQPVSFSREVKPERRFILPAQPHAKFPVRMLGRSHRKRRFRERRPS